MNIRFWGLLIGLVFSVPGYAFPCFITLAKDNCWINYDVKVTVIDSLNNKELITVIVPKGESWSRQEFACQPAQKLMYLAKFEPPIWEKQVGKTYRALRYWSMPGAIKEGETAWNIPVCYASDFAETPMPPDSSGQCACDFSGIPPVPPQ